MMPNKHCPFCNELVPTEPAGDYDRFIGCFCSPGGNYHLLSDSYSAIQSFSYVKKRALFPIVSAYIREKTGDKDRVFLTLDDMDIIPNYEGIPATMAEKEARLLQFLYKNSEAPGEAVVLHPLLQHYNLTYSLNLQEFVYIIEKLRDRQCIKREGGTLRLTETGWQEAAAGSGGRKRKSCLVLMSSDEEYEQEWLETVLPKLEQLGYIADVADCSNLDDSDTGLAHLIVESKLIVADVTHRPPTEYFAAGYALALNIPVVWTMKPDRGNPGHTSQLPLRPVLWNTTEELSDALANAVGSL